MATFFPVTGVKIPQPAFTVGTLPIYKRSGPLPSFSVPGHALISLLPIYKRSGPLPVIALTGAAWPNPLTMKPVPPLPGVSGGGGGGGTVGYPI